jgi:hypothetical protein
MGGGALEGRLLDFCLDFDGDGRFGKVAFGVLVMVAIYLIFDI